LSWSRSSRFDHRLILNWFQVFGGVKPLFVFFWNIRNCLYCFHRRSDWFLICFGTLRLRLGYWEDWWVELRLRGYIHFVFIWSKSLHCGVWFLCRILGLFRCLFLSSFWIEVVENRFVRVWSSNFIDHVRLEIISIIFINILPQHMFKLIKRHFYLLCWRRRWGCVEEYPNSFERNSCIFWPSKNCHSYCSWL